MNLEESFQDAIAQAPADPIAKLVYADWLGEQNDPMESVVRWCARENKWPEWREAKWRQAKPCWHWWALSQEGSPAVLPMELCTIITSGRYWYAPTIREALALLDRALQRSGARK